MKTKLVKENLNESPWLINRETDKLDYISDEELADKIAKHGAKKISIKEAFPGAIKTPYVGLVVKINNDSWGCIVGVFERNDEYLFDLFTSYKGEWDVNKNLRWSTDYKTAYGDRIHGWGAFGDNGKPNKRHEEEIIPFLDETEDVIGIDLGIAAPENLN